MNIKMLKAALAGLVLSVSGFANAGLIVIDGLMDITETSGQEETWSFTPVINNVGGGTLYLSGEGDFEGSHEFMSIFIESNNLFATLLDGNGDDVDYFSGTSGSKDGYTWAAWNHTIAIDESTLTSILSDNTFSLKLALSSGVSTYWDDDFVSWSLSYNSTPVPEPSTLAIFALGIMGLAARRFKKQS
ncbi:PEP-CTERM sorting domain-containing protein [Colwellia demingiae]|uniref:PEP-CTERM sorting domain-containing protein n=1 Tax=Colwellia demingiae TaxID=89401 RepID=UPI001FE9F25B|nr:PEP-CTERM sorting domain-containing protein [Colwellia demingiae]